MTPRLLRSTLLIALTLAPTAARAQELRTVAEKSDYQATSRHADVLNFCEELARRSPLVRLGELGTSGEGRKLPLVILADPPVSTAEEARKSGKLIVYVQANIHAGEVDGKEGLLMLARDLALDPAKPLLKDLVLVLCPDFNPDGNEKFSKNNRRSQNGPPEVGVRANAAGLDLNRDFVKLESPEVRALVRLLNQWDPALLIDCHTTNGSHHRYTLTYDAPRHPNAGAALVEYGNNKLLPDAGRRLERKTGFKSFVYGNFSRDYTRWTTYGTTARYGIPYVGLRGRLAVLSESYSYAPYRDRVIASRDFVRSCLEHVAEHKDAIRKLLAENPQGDSLAVRTDTVAQPNKFTALGFEEEMKDGRRVATDRPRDYELQVINRVEPAERVSRPFAYLFPPRSAKAVEVLQRHGIKVEELREDIELPVEAYRVEKVEHTDNPFQGHRETTVRVTPQKQTWRAPAGTVLVRTGQPLGTLAGLLLEPRSEDGLTTWNFFDDALTEGGEFPVRRLPQAVPLTAGPVRPLPEDRVMNKRLSPETVFKEERPLSFAGEPTSIQSWLEDGEHYLQVKEGKLCKVHARSGRAEPFVDVAKLTQSLAALPTIDRAAAERLARGPNYRMDPKRTAALFEHENDLYYARFDGSPAMRLTRSPGQKELATFSPDGRFVAFVRGGNLFVTDIATQSERALTTDGGGPILNGKADWVYEEEVFLRSAKAYWWSPDSKSIVFLRLDDNPVPKFTVVNHLPTHLEVETIPYPKAGDPNPLATLHVVSAAGGDPVAVDLSGYSPTASLIIRAGWLPDGKSVFFYVQDRAQTWLDVCTAPAKGGPAKRLFRETTSAWVDDPGDPHFLADGSFLFASERSGWKHLYHYDAAGKLLKPVTSGAWEVRGSGNPIFQEESVLHVDEQNGWVYFTAMRDNVVATNLYRAKLDGSGQIERLTRTPGEHAVRVNPTGTLFIDSHSDTSTPIQVHLVATDGTPVRALDTNPVYNREEYRFAPYERVQVPLSDSFVLEGSITRPLDFDPDRRYPVWFMTYGGPHAPTIVDAWQGGRVYDQVLASLGFVVFRCDPRSASGKGACSAWTCYRKLGVQECKDVETAIDWLCKHHPYVDPQRIGMDGHSYGGFLTAFCLTHTKKFAAGISGAPVTDWHNYDTIYTERYMNTPQENPDGYDVTSVVKAAKDLHGRLLLLHGLRDDNVHPQNSVQLINELQRLDKDFEVMVYPQDRHGIRGKHYQRLKLDFIQRTLGDGNGKSRGMP